MLVDLYPKFRKIASVYANSTLDEAEDIAQDMILACLEKQAENPEFLNQNESYILHQGRYQAWARLRDTKTFEKHAYYVDMSDDDEELGYREFRDPEDVLIEKEELEALVAAASDLSSQEKTVVSLVVSGLGTNQIAEKLGVTAAAVSGYKARAIRKFQKAVL